MNKKLDIVFKQALKDETSKKIDGKGYECRCIMGIKIIRDNLSGEIEIINTKKGGQYYGALSQEEYFIFLENGWKIGVYTLSLSNYRSKLDIIEQRIKQYINDKKSEKQIGILKSSRERILNKYSEINSKLNQLNQLNYGNKVNREEADNV